MNSEIPLDPQFIEQLIQEEGLSYAEAIQVAMTEMDGAIELEDGIDSYQTYCDELGYNETTGERQYTLKSYLIGRFFGR